MFNGALGKLAFLRTYRAVTRLKVGIQLFKSGGPSVFDTLGPRQLTRFWHTAGQVRLALATMDCVLEIADLVVPVLDDLVGVRDQGAGG